MIFVTVGTTAFNGLVKAADDLNEKDIIIQKADGSYVPQNHESFEYSDKFEDYIQKAEVVVTHGGAGTLFHLLGMGKRVVGVANEERSDLHQWDLLKKLSEEGHIIWCQNLKALEGCIAEAKNKEFKKYTAPENEIITEILKLA